MNGSLAPPGQPEQMSRLGHAQYPGYVGGGAANNLTFSLTSMFLLVYSTDVAGIAAGAAGAVLLVCRVWGAFTDILAGRVIDRTSTLLTEERFRQMVAEVAIRRASSAGGAP
jgi:glucuronide carrier protein